MWFNKFLDEYVGYINAVRIEDYTQIFVSLLAGMCIGIIILAWCGYNTATSIRFNNTEFMRIEDKDGEQITLFRSSRTFLQELSRLVTTIWIKFGINKKSLGLHQAKKARRIFITLSSIIIFSFILALIFAWNVESE